MTDKVHLKTAEHEIEESQTANSDDAVVANSSVVVPDHVEHAPNIPLKEDDSRIGQSKLFDLGQIDVQWEPELNTLWAFITPLDRPNYNLGLLRDTMTWQMEAKRVFGHDNSPLKYMVLGSRFPGVFNLGGDLEMFARCI